MPRKTNSPKRVLEQETDEQKIVAGKKSEAMSSHQALFYHDIPPELLRRIAKRYTGGHVKYSKEITMNLNWRMGLNDPHYVMDRLNHMIGHMVEFLDTGNQNDDNLGAIAWCAGFLMEVERLHPKVLKQIIGQSRFSGNSATYAREFLRRVQK